MCTGRGSKLLLPTEKVEKLLVVRDSAQDGFGLKGEGGTPMNKKKRKGKQKPGSTGKKEFKKIKYQRQVKQGRLKERKRSKGGREGGVAPH